MKQFLYISLLAVAFWACNNSGNQRQAASGKLQAKDPVQRVQVPEFNPDSAYAYIEKQLSFGPRVPNTTAHKACGKWMVSKFESFGAVVLTQEDRVEAFDGTLLQMKNIIAQFEPEKANRLLLMAHWDSRPYADHDPDESRRNEPIAGANDGASGVGVLLEIARQLQGSKPTMGIDIILFDAEDYGVPDHLDFEWSADTWCLGSQYWAKNPHKKDYYARYGILLDMVGAKNATFTQEEVSVHYAKSVVDQVWKTARELGYGQYFPYTKTPQIVDDHRYVNELIGIPSIDIVQYDPATESNFGSFWHTHNDNLDVIDKATLQAVGDVVLNVIFNEQ